MPSGKYSNPYFDHSLDVPYENFVDGQPEIVINYRSRRSSEVHFHDSFEFLYVVDGELELELAGEKHTIHAGQISAASSFIPHGTDSVVAPSWLLIVPRRVIGGMDDIMNSKTFAKPIIEDTNGLILSLIKLIYAAYSRSGCFASMENAAAEVLMIGYVNQFVRTVASLSGLCEKSGTTGLSLQAIEYINRHFREELHVSDITRALLCNRYTLSSQFRRTFGITLNDYINRVRVTEVERLLNENPGMLLREAADLAGFGSLRTLHRVWREEFGTTPRDRQEG